MSQYKRGQPNPKDYYLLIFTDTGKVYEYFRNGYTAERFKLAHPLKDELEVIINPKYKK